MTLQSSNVTIQPMIDFRLYTLLSYGGSSGSEHTVGTLDPQVDKTNQILSEAVSARVAFLRSWVMCPAPGQYEGKFARIYALTID